MKYFKKSDLFLVLGLLVVCFAAWFVLKNGFAGKDKHAEIYYRDKLVKTVDLNKGIDQRFSLPQHPHVIFHLSKDGSICFEQSDCPDKICVKSGKLNTVGQYAACLPNQLMLKIVSDQKGDHDVDYRVR